MSISIAVETRGETLIVRFMRPEMRNPLSVHLLESLDRIIDEGLDSANVEKLVFTGTGNVFASGADLREIAALTSENAREFSLLGQKLMEKIAEFPKPTIAAINGFCFGGALDLALACARRIAASNATFAHPGAGLGIITGWGGTQRLPRLVGQANAMEIFFTASPITADNALRIGLIDSISDDPVAAALRY
jgi:enoyl-CoA hydratase